MTRVEMDAAKTVTVVAAVTKDCAGTGRLMDKGGILFSRGDHRSVHVILQINT
jgi:hypothetical protein